MYAKLFSRITESSILEESVTTRWVFVALLAIAESDGTVIGTDVAIARRINVPLSDFEESMKVLMAPDPHSNNLDFGGARIILSSGERGYFLTGYARYRSLKTEDERRQYMKEYMAKKRSNVNSVNFPLAQLTHAEVEAQAEKDLNLKRDGKIFRTPSAVEVKDYASSIGFSLDGQKFVDYYEAAGWMRGKTKIKDWKACVRTWKATQEKIAKSNPHRQPAPVVSGPAADPFPINQEGEFK